MALYRSFSKNKAREMRTKNIIWIRAYRNYVDWRQLGVYEKTGIYMGKDFTLGVFRIAFVMADGERVVEGSE